MRETRGREKIGEGNVKDRIVLRNWGKKLEKCTRTNNENKNVDLGGNRKIKQQLKTTGPMV